MTAFIAASLVTLDVAAQGAPADLAKADALYLEGNTAYDKGDFAAAARSYTEAWRLKKAYDIAGNLCASEVKLGRYRDAAEHCAASLKAFPTNGKATSRDKIASNLKDARAQVGALTLTTNLAQVSLTIDGEPIATPAAGDELFVAPGAHVVVAKAKGYGDVTQNFDVTAGASKALKLTLSEQSGDRPGSGPAVGTGWIVATSVLTAGALGLGIGLTVAAGSKHDEAQSISASLPAGACAAPASANVDACTRLRDAAKSHDTLAGIGVAGFVGAAAFGATTAVLLIVRATSHNAPASTALQVLPSIGPGSGGLHLIGEF